MRKFILLLFAWLFLMPVISYASGPEPVSLPWIMEILNQDGDYNVEYTKNHKHILVRNIKDKFKFQIGMGTEYYMRMAAFTKLKFSNQVTEDKIHKLAYELTKEIPIGKVKLVKKDDEKIITVSIEIQTMTDKKHFRSFFTAYETVLRDAVAEKLVKKAKEIDQ